MTLILRGAYTHGIFSDVRLLAEVGMHASHCGIVVDAPYDRLCTVSDRDATELVDCPKCLRARLDQLDEVAE